MLLCTVCGQPPRSFLLLRCDDCGALCCFGCAGKVEDGLKTALACGACGSHQVRDTLANNWSDFPDLQRPIPWQTATGGQPHIVFEAQVDGAHWTVRVNDFPDEPLCTLLVNGREVIHFDDWPAFWGEQPALPKPPKDPT
jgi:hypothetical protein